MQLGFSFGIWIVLLYVTTYSLLEIDNLELVDIKSCPYDSIQVSFEFQLIFLVDCCTVNTNENIIANYWLDFL